jgi:hypothetical protein
MVFEPVGPLPASTYWRRRGVLLAVVLVLLFLLKSCVGGGGSTPKPQASTKPSATPSASATPKVTASPRPTATKPPVAAGGACTDAVLKLEVKTDADTYTVGSSPTFTMTITNTSSVACTRDLGSKAVSLRVISGTARTWDSDDCTTGSDSDSARLTPRVPKQVVSLTWSGKRSQPGCPSPRPQAAPGTYQVFGTVGTLQSARVVFHFR